MVGPWRPLHALRSPEIGLPGASDGPEWVSVHSYVTVERDLHVFAPLGRCLGSLGWCLGGAFLVCAYWIATV